MIKQISGSFVEWCAQVVNGDDYVILDTETTGLRPNDQVIELAIISTSCEVLYNKFLKPSCPIDAGAMAIHHITEEMIADARCLKEEWGEIQRAIGGRNIITYNAAFDYRMLRQSAVAHNVTLPEMTWYCMMDEYMRYYQYSRWVKLNVACYREGIQFEQDHRALGDTMATLELIRAMAKRAEALKR